MSKLNLTIPDLSYAAEEALNRLRVNVKFSGKSTKKLLITSSVPNEGKSHIAIYLWKMLAEAGFRTVFVDGDLRKSVLKDEMDYTCEDEDLKGLAYYLSGMGEYDEVVHQTNIENADIIPCTNLLQNPSPLLEDPRLEELLNQLAENYDYVIIDSPPLVSVSDGALFAALCDGAILVVRCAETPRGLVRQSINQLARTRCRLLGMVLNGVETNKRAYGKYYGYGGYYYSRYYSYYYGGDYYGGSDEGTEQSKKKKHKHRKKES